MDAVLLAFSRVSYEEAGVAIVAVSAAVALTAAFLLRRRLPAPLVVALLTLAGAGLGFGGMLLRFDPHPAETMAAVALLAFLVPAHVRIVLGPFGPRRASS